MERWLYNVLGCGYGNVVLWLFMLNNVYVGDIVKDERWFVVICLDIFLDFDFYV